MINGNITELNSQFTILLNQILVPFNNSYYGEITTNCAPVTGYKAYAVVGAASGLISVNITGAYIPNGQLYVGCVSNANANLNQNVLVQVMVLYKKV